ncbi:hypothetical protein ED733_004681 [Metarhizium rileyi]|uniref:Uncharacterized protein n=1 Tax=Metarhizium rileyi (strain RCEF 4871) TaxID=1649241 RepID=A0A5C6GA78_METRR|nr:hypothetical protein ED733_004681 [Metarhizium rileyi]
MGNSCSQPRNEAGPGARKLRKRRRGGMNIGLPQEVMINIPCNRVSRHGLPVEQATPDVGREVLLAALQHVAQYIAHRGKNFTVIAVGGAVNTLYLKSRSTTHDVNIFGSTFTNQARILLDEAVFDAQQHHQDLRTNWLNTKPQMWMKVPLHSELTAAAERQNVRVFDMPGLTIYAAPWEYAFSAKVNQILLGSDQARPYDLDDAVTYIHEYICAHDNQPVLVTTALDWARQFNHENTAEFLRTGINEAYGKRYGGKAFE